MGRARNNIAAVAGQVQDRRQDLFAAAMGDTRGARRSGDLAAGAERIRQLGFDAPGLAGQAELFADEINRQTLEQRGRVNILEGVPDFTAQDVAPLVSIALKHRAAARAAARKTTFDAGWMQTALVNLIVIAGGDQRPWDMTSDGSFMLENLLWAHGEMVGAVGGEGNPAFDISAEVTAIEALYERLCEHFRVPDERRSPNLWRQA